VTDAPSDAASLGHHTQLIGRITVADELQATIVELIDLALLGKQLSWSATGPRASAVRRMLEELVVRLRIHTDEVAARMLELGHLPNGQSRAVAIETDLTPLPPGRLDAEGASAALMERIEQVRTRLVRTRQTTVSDATSTELLANIHDDLLAVDVSPAGLSD